MTSKMLFQALRVSRRVPPCRLLLHQHLSTRLASTFPLPESNPVHESERRDMRRNENQGNVRTAYIRTWKPIANMADAWALLRMVERKYGAVVEAHFLKDFEVPTSYQMMSYIIFRDPDSLQRIPQDGEEFVIPAAGIPKPHYELGMEDLEHLAKSEEYQPGYEPPPPLDEKNMMGGNIFRANREFLDLNAEHRLFQNTSKAAMESFVRWGGFSPLRPIGPSRRIIEQELFGPTDLDQVRMRTALQICSKYTDIRNPGVIGPVHSQPQAPTGKSIPSSSRLFAGLYKNASHPDPSLLKRDPSSIDSPSPTPDTTTDASASPSQLEKEVHPDTPSSETKKPTRKAPVPLSAEELAEKEKLGKQINAARQLQQATAPVRKKQRKPQIKVAKKPRADDFLDQMPPPPPPPEGKGILAKLWGLFGR